jgi:hypothetical protein
VFHSISEIRRGRTEIDSIRFCEAGLLDGNSINLFIHESNPAYDDRLRIWITNGRFKCQFWTLYKWNHGHLVWITKRRKLTLDKKEFRKGDIIKGRIDFECVQEMTDTDSEHFRKYGRNPISIEIYGVFKTIVK